MSLLFKVYKCPSQQVVWWEMCQHQFDHQGRKFILSLVLLFFKSIPKCSTNCYNTYSSGKGTVPILISLFLYLHKWIMVQLIFTGTFSTWLFWCFLTLGSLLTFMFIAEMRSLSGSDIKSEINISDSNQYVHTELRSGNLWILCIQKNSRFSYK